MDEQDRELPATGIEKADHLLYAAWTVIANAGQGDWTRESEEWQQAAAQWRDNWHNFIDENRARFLGT